MENVSLTPKSVYHNKNKNLTGSSNANLKNKEVAVALMSPDGDSIDTVASEDGRVSKFCHQFFILLRRSFVCIWRDTVSNILQRKFLFYVSSGLFFIFVNPQMLTHLRFTFTVMVGLLIGAIFHDAGNNADQTFNNAGNLFFGLLFMVFAAMMSTVLTFPLERGVLVREHLNCWYSLKSYYLARTLADLPFQVITYIEKLNFTQKQLN